MHNAHYAPPPPYFTKLRGVSPSQPRHRAIPCSRILWSSLGSFLGIFVLAYLHYLPIFAESDMVPLVGSFGAHAVLVFAAPHSPLAQPWNAVVGNLISACIGVTCFKLVGQSDASAEVYTVLGEDGRNWIAAPLAVSLSILCMHVTASLHPPGGAIALIATIGSSGIKRSGYLYVLVPGLLSSSIQVLIGLVVNNFSQDDPRRYPRRWAPALAFGCSCAGGEGESGGKDSTEARSTSGSTEDSQRMEFQITNPSKDRIFI